MSAFIEKYKLAAILLVVALGFLLRIRGLSAQGLNEDEVNKAEAAQAYRQGDFLQNREHPMLLKSLVTVSITGTGVWNRSVNPRWQIAQETAIRLPNAIFGSLTAIVIFLIAREFFASAVGLIAALVWSISPLAIVINRVAKEDTLLVFFTWLGYYFYLRAKRSDPLDTSRQEKLYALSGASFGLMLASKYFPHYFGLNFLYYRLLGRRGQHYASLGKRGYAILFGALVLAFVLANPVIALPSTWDYMSHYVREETMTHHGYLMMGHLYYNDPAHLFAGMPSYSYVLFLLIKTQLPLLLALVVGLAESIHLRRERGHFFLLFMFAMWMVPFSLLVMKWFRYMLSLMPMVSILAAIGVVKIFRMTSVIAKRRGALLRAILVPAVAGVFFFAPVVTVAKAAPFYSLYLNPFGRGRVGYYFPHDELDEIGLREAILQVSREAPAGALLGGEAPPVLHYYVRRFGRNDLHNFRLSDDLEGLAKNRNAEPVLFRTSLRSSAARKVPVYAIVQEGRKYFDNISSISAIESQERPAVIVKVRGVSAAKIYRLDNFKFPIGPEHRRQEVESRITHLLLSKTSGSPQQEAKPPGP